MIYIVEDDAAIRELEQYALQSSGYEVQSFETSEPFWQAMRTAEPELVILDVMLPGEDGFSILKKLRNTPALRRLPIIMVTAKSSELDTVRGLDCGADDYITKPFGIMEFLSRVRAALRRSAPEEKQNVYAFHEILLDNAIRYNRPGGKVQLITSCTRDGHCTLTVKDNGIGIPKDAQSSVFERFYRVDKSRSKATGGTGLGLAIVKHIARIHNARIKLESEVNVGTTITIVFETAH